MYKFISAVAVVFFLFIVWMIYLANTGGNSIFFDLVRRIPYGDKLGHACLFGFLTLVSIIGLKFRSLSLARIRIYYGVLLVSVFVVLEEASQIFIASRTFDFIDLAADGIGILLAALTCYIAERFIKISPNELIN